jgi:hypothetical protein
MKKLLLTTLTVFAFSAQAEFLGSCHNWNSGSSGAGAAAIAAATAENKKAKKADFEWRDTGKMIKAAGEALDPSTCDAKAVSLANAARDQALDAQQQAKDQANAGPSNHF